MTIPLLEVIPTAQNHRVEGFEVGTDELPVPYRTSTPAGIGSVEEVIWAAYRQIFSEHVILASSRQPYLESQLRNGSLSARDFMRGLGKSETYYRLVVEPNSNYRVVEVTLKRFLGRAPYNLAETIAWSIVIAERGFNAFIDAIVDSDEYLSNFGDDTVPYQRRRMGERPFNLVTPRYGAYWRDKLANEFPRQGDIRNFLDMARQLRPQAAPVMPVSTAGIAIPNTVREGGGPVSVRGTFRFPAR